MDVGVMMSEPGESKNDRMRGAEASEVALEVFEVGADLEVDKCVVLNCSSMCRFTIC